MTRPAVYTDATGAALNVDWAKNVLGGHGCALQFKGEATWDDDELWAGGVEAAPRWHPPPPWAWKVALVHVGTTTILAEIDCEAGARVRAAKQLVVALDTGLLP